MEKSSLSTHAETTSSFPIIAQLSNFPKVSFKPVNLRSFPPIPSPNANVSLIAEWIRSDDKLFENSIALIDENDPNPWEKIAAQLPGKTVEQIKEHYELLLKDIQSIDSGMIPIPRYFDDDDDDDDDDEEEKTLDDDCMPADVDYNLSAKEEGLFMNDKKRKNRNAERKKGIPWTEQEHRLFLLGLNKHGRGDWKSISRNYVKTRTPTQVASHAQKYFNRSNNQVTKIKERRRSSIHDIRNINNTSETCMPSNNHKLTIQASNMGMLICSMPTSIRGLSSNTLAANFMNHQQKSFGYYYPSNDFSNLQPSTPNIGFCPNMHLNNLSGGFVNFSSK